MFPDFNVDYIVANLTLEYPSMLCVTVIIVDDLALESFLEDFTVDVIGTTIPGGTNPFGLPSFTVEIQDNESN